MRFFRLFLSIILISGLTIDVLAQAQTNSGEGFIFKDKIVLPTTSVKDQHRTGT